MQTFYKKRMQRSEKMSPYLYDSDSFFYLTVEENAWNWTHKFYLLLLTILFKNSLIQPYFYINTKYTKKKRFFSSSLSFLRDILLIHTNANVMHERQVKRNYLHNKRLCCTYIISRSSPSRPMDNRYKRPIM